jgi:hypothetical protein
MKCPNCDAEMREDEAEHDTGTATSAWLRGDRSWHVR